MPSWILFAALAVFFLFVLPRLGTISSEKAHQLVAAGARLVDVRTPGEFASGHLPGALNVPLGDLEARMGELLPKEQPLVLYCASGMRSGSAKKVLAGHGFTQVFNLGGMSRW